LTAAILPIALYKSIGSLEFCRFEPPSSHMSLSGAATLLFPP